MHMNVTGINSSNCFLCKETKETITHFFLECYHAKKIWKKLATYLKDTYSLDIKWNFFNIITAQVNMKENLCVNAICMIAKQKMYASKCIGTQCKAESIINEFEFIHEMEHKKVLRTNNTKRYNKTWPDYIRPMGDNSEQNNEQFVLAYIDLM